MKQLILIPVRDKTIDASFYRWMAEWAKGQKDDTYITELPKPIERDRTVLQSNAYWGRCTWMVKTIGEYSKNGYHSSFMEMCGYGDYYKRPNGDIGFAPDSLTNIKISQIDSLLTAQEHYVSDRNEDLPPDAHYYLPSPEEFKRARMR